MPTKIVIKKNTYFDSVSLMSVSTKGGDGDGNEQRGIKKPRAINAGISGREKRRPDDRY
ncbi:protein YahF [Enterobacter cloacae]|nr:protein YahF [Enterobacter cloacae]